MIETRTTVPVYGETDLPVGTHRELSACIYCGGTRSQIVEYSPPSGPWPATHEWSKVRHEEGTCLGVALKRIKALEAIVEELRVKKDED